MAHNKLINDNIVSVLDCVVENISEVECGNSGGEVSDNQNSNQKSIISHSEKVNGAPVICRWHDVKCDLFISFSYHTSSKYFVYVCLCKEHTIIYIIM
jgi:hypothetical protein